LTETNNDQNAYRLRELSEGLDRLAGLAREIDASFSPAAAEIGSVWASAPLLLKLKFVREILPEEADLQPALREASALEELRQRGNELETWLVRYPALFADAAALLRSRASDNESAYRRGPALTLGMSTLAEAQEALDKQLVSYQIEWIAPSPGDQVTASHEVVGEEPSSYTRQTVAKLVRPGFCRKGKLELLAQVVRSTGPAVIPAEDAPDSSNTQYPIPNTLHDDDPSPLGALGAGSNLSHEGRGTGGSNTLQDEERAADPSQHPTPNTQHPTWLRILGQRTQGCHVEAVTSLVESLRELVAASCQSEAFENRCQRDDRSDSIIASLASLLSMRYADSLPGINAEWGAALLEARDSILLWLRDTLSVDLISPLRGDRFDSDLMDAVETRRTVHANEVETVARVERIGFTRAGSLLLRAQVVRYVAGRE